MNQNAVDRVAKLIECMACKPAIAWVDIKEYPDTVVLTPRHERRSEYVDAAALRGRSTS